MYTPWQRRRQGIGTVTGPPGWLEIVAVLIAFTLRKYTAAAFIRNTPSPDFLPTPTNVTYHKGELAVLRCTIYNLGTKTVVWRRQENSFPLTSGTTTIVDDDRLQIGHVAYKNQWDLMIKNVQPDDEGFYECQVSSRDKKSRRLIALTVIDPEMSTPEIELTGTQYVNKGEPIVLQCNATGEYYPPDEMDWFKNGQRLASSRHRGMSISKRYSISQRRFTSILTIARADMDDGGTYLCRSSNMQITSTKVHVLNAETFNKKRGTVHDKLAASKSYDDSAGAITVLHTVLRVLPILHVCFMMA